MTTRARFIVLAGVVSVAAILTLYVASAFLALGDLTKAVQSGDRDRLAARVDFPSVRASLKEQLDDLIDRQARLHREFAANPFGRLILALAPRITDAVVDGIVTPDGIAQMLSRPLGGASGPRKHPGERFERSWSFTGSGDFEAAYTSDRDAKLTFALVFALRDFTWKVVRIDLPSEELSRRFGGRAS